MEEIIKIENFSVYTKNKTILYGINLPVYKNKVNTIVGPSGTGKSTLLRSINRLIENNPEFMYSGKIIFNEKDVFEYPVEELRKKIGFVFQHPNPFSFSIYDNVAFGPRLHYKLNDGQIDAIVEKSLKDANLYDEVKANLKKSAMSLSGGQQQRLCIARAIAIKPDILMMDEPTSSLDPIARNKIEELVLRLKEKYTVILVTHDVRQAAKISDYISFLYDKRIIEHGNVHEIFENPKNKITEEFLTDRMEDKNENKN
ncbi:MAG: phosphate ABC transporter ATP-binding protein [Thermoplasmata archaeon]